MGESDILQLQRSAVYLGNKLTRFCKEIGWLSLGACVWVFVGC